MKNNYVHLLVMLIPVMLLTNSCSMLGDKKHELNWEITYARHHDQKLKSTEILRQTLPALLPI